ncbi:hypothetical protein SBA1_1470013 [Candidatus Sulfotelmatobacter kueseliae]|uniref:Uncharacterized protein n=1 Tax=Candidatus Sulfotelmatobacter kueseliae TaxID=2042962 RepID=A0A2U3K8C4_9BACT|nr:hypothetical protein SBA1_1470013 [Candidatus Sulfotelmatobacter kueseliae]
MRGAISKAAVMRRRPESTPEGGHPEDEPVGQRWGKVEPALWRRRRSHSRAVANTPPKWFAVSVSLRRAMLPSSSYEDFGLWGDFHAFTRCGPMTRSPSFLWLRR